MASESVEFNNILEMVRDGNMNKEYRDFLFKYSRFKMGQSKFLKSGFDDQGVSRLLCNNKDENNYNDYHITNLQKNKARYIANLTAVNSANAQKFTDRQTSNLPNELSFVWIQKMY